MSTADGPEVIHMTRAEWEAAVQSALDRLGLTYEELADMARRRSFDTVEQRKLWVSIGGVR